MKKRLLKAITISVLAMSLGFGLTACGKQSDETSKGNLTGYYASTTNVGYMSAYPEHTFKQATFSVQSIETFSDNTYCLTATDTFYSGDLHFDDNGEYEVVPRGANVTKYYGTVTPKNEEGLVTLELSKPTSVIVNSSYSAGSNPVGYLNTQAWTDEMGQAAGGEGAALTADEYLEKVSFPSTSIVVDAAQASFDYVVLNESGEKAQ